MPVNALNESEPLNQCSAKNMDVRQISLDKDRGQLVILVQHIALFQTCWAPFSFILHPATTTARLVVLRLIHRAEMGF